MSDFDNLDEDDGEGRSRRRSSTKFCVECGEKIRYRAEICPKCGVRQPMDLDDDDGPGGSQRAIREYSGSKVAAGICGILLGSLGIHKFILGLTMPGVIMLLVSIVTCGFGAIPMAIIGMVEGIIYLSKSDRDFYLTYVRGKKGWF